MKTILFIDDDSEFLSAQKDYFSGLGYKVLTAESGKDAMDLLENETPDLVVLELMLEHFDTGFTLGYQIRKMERFATIPILMLSSVASVTGKRFDSSTKELRRWSGIDSFIDKPVDQGQLHKLIQERIN